MRQTGIAKRIAVGIINRAAFAGNQRGSDGAVRARNGVPNMRRHRAAQLRQPCRYRIAP